MEKKKKRKIIKKIVVTIIMLLLAGSWAYAIYSLSDMNTHNSNGHSTEFIGMFIEDSLDITNEYGITNSHPTIEKIDKASKLLNAPLRKVMHASVYFVLSFILIAYISFMLDMRKYIIAALITLILCAGYAASDEYHQTKVEGRTGQVRDVLIDSTGALVGVLFYGTYYISYRLGYKSCEKELLDDMDIDEDARLRSKLPIEEKEVDELKDTIKIDIEAKEIEDASIKEMEIEEKNQEVKEEKAEVEEKKKKTTTKKKSTKKKA